MTADEPLLPPQKRVPTVSSATLGRDTLTGTVATRDHELIKAWAGQHDAEPATGEATRSGPATLDVHDGGAGVRFNFPGVGRYRPISWDEWFENFDRYDLLFVYEEPMATADASYRIVRAAKWQD